MTYWSMVQIAPVVIPSHLVQEGQTALPLEHDVVGDAYAMLVVSTSVIVAVDNHFTPSPHQHRYKKRRKPTSCFLRPYLHLTLYHIENGTFRYFSVHFHLFFFLLYISEFTESCRNFPEQLHGVFSWYIPRSIS